MEPRPERAREVTIVAHDIGPIGGMERQLTELINGLLSKGFHVRVVARRCDLPENPGLEWFRVPGPARPFPIAYPWFMIFGSWQLLRHRRGIVHTTGAIVVNRVDVCTVHHCHLASRTTTQGAWASLNFARRVNRRVSGALARFFERRLYRRRAVRRFVTVSEGVATELRTYLPGVSNQVTVIPNAVDQHIFRPDQRARAEVRAATGLAMDDFVAIFVGGDWPLKGLSSAIRAVGEVPDCHLLVVGGGEPTTLEPLIRDSGADGRIHFAGRRADVARYYAAADVFVLPTSYESFSLATYEAAACELPLLVTRVSGVEDLLRDGENGWFIQRDPQTIAPRLRTLKQDPQTTRRMGARSRQLVERFSWNRVVDDYIALYRDLGMARVNPVKEYARRP